MLPSSSATELPKQYDHAAAQQRWRKQWEERRYFHAEANDPARPTPFSIVIPPPNVTGALHLGHALNATLQDILIRTKRMQGFNALWMPGADHAGIATQAVVERRLLQEEKLSRHDLGREKLVERIWAWKHDYEARILEQLKQMGCSCDFERTRFTLDEMCARAVRQTFFHMFRDGLIYRGKRLVNWDTFLQTAVSDDEVYHETVQGFFWHLKYPVIGPLPGEPAFVHVATTRPETMLGDTAVAVHPDPAAALDQAERDLSVKLADAAAKDQPELKRQLDELGERRRTMLPLLVKLRDMAAAGRKVRLPLLDRPIPLVADEWAKPELGSGCVKITPAHDPNDYEVGKRQSLPMINILNPDGTLNDNAGPYRGLTLKQARERVVADLDGLGLVDKVEGREIDLAHSDRSKTPIEPYLADQWFVKMGDHDDGRKGLAQMAMDAVTDGRVTLHPPRYAKGYLDWLSEKRDWPVSRQLWWGHRIPVWYATGPERTIQATFGRRTDVALQFDAENQRWLVCPLDDLRPEAISRDIQLSQDPDVLDTWFSSALWPHSTLGWPENTPELQAFYPTNVLLTSRDIITLWVARMVLAGLYNLGQIPFHQVYIHPKILDGFGEGMSKSKGNGVDPLDVIAKFGADALRFALTSMATETQDVRMPVEFECPHCEKTIEQTQKNRVLPRIVCPHCGGAFSTQWASKPEDAALPRGMVTSERFEVARNFCNKLWNAARFALLNLSGYTPGQVDRSRLAIEDRWMLSRLATVTEQVTAAIETFRFADAARSLYDFAWDEFCSFYLEMIKTRLQDPREREVAQRVLAHALDTLLRLLHPVVPFLTEEVWQLLALHAPMRGLDNPSAAAESICIAPWPAVEKSLQDAEIEARFARFAAVLGGLREIRSRQNILPKTPIRFTVRCDDDAAALLRPMAPYFHSMAGASADAWGHSVAAPPLSASFAFPGGEVFVDLSAHIDLNAEIERNEKELAKIDGFIAAKEKKLANESFVSRAPADVIARERDQLAELKHRRNTTSASLADLQSRQPS